MIVWSGGILILRWSCFKDIVQVIVVDWNEYLFWFWQYFIMRHHMCQYVPSLWSDLRATYDPLSLCLNVGNCPDRPLESSPFALLTAYFIQDMMPSTVKQGAGLQNENYVRLTVSDSSRSWSSLQFQTWARSPILLSISLARCQMFLICSRRGGKASSLKVAFDIACTCFLVANYSLKNQMHEQI